MNLSAGYHKNKFVLLLIDMKKVLIILITILCLKGDQDKKTEDQLISYEQFAHLKYKNLLLQKEESYDVYIYYPSCQYCYSLLPLISEKTKIDDNYVVFFLKIDETVNLSRLSNQLPICQLDQFHINGFPQLIHVEKGCITKLFLGKTSIIYEIENNRLIALL